MRTVVISSVMVATLVGCGRPSSNVAPPNSGQAGPPVEASPVAAPKTIESRLSGSEIPTTPDALKDEFVRRFNEDNYGAFRDLCYWEGVPDDVKQKDMTIFMIGMKNSKATVARIEPCSPDEFESHFRNIDFPAESNLTPTHSLYVETKQQAESGDDRNEGGDDFDAEPNTAGKYPVGIKDGGYYLCVGVLPPPDHKEDSDAN